MIITYLPIQRGFAFWPFVFIPKWIKNIPGEDAYIAHEITHAKRQAWWAPIWIILYFASKKFRFREETLAYRAQIEKLGGVREVAIEHYAACMSEKYWGMCSYEEAKSALEGEG